MEQFYVEVLSHLSKGFLKKDMRILVVCGGKTDMESFQKCGFENVVISNLDTRMKGDEFAPYSWSFQDAENLKFEDKSFDFVVVHSGLHHCESPHRGMLEMYRVARIGILLFEPYDNLASRLAIRLQFGQEFEHAAVFHNDFAFGGLKNTSIPNYVYRMTKREIIKSITCYAPFGKHGFEFIHKMRLPFGQLEGKRNKLYYYSLVCLSPFLNLFGILFPQQCNNFAAIVVKPSFIGETYPWLKRDGEKVELDRDWLQKRYRKS